MKLLRLVEILRKWAPAAIVLLALTGMGWVVGQSFTKTFDGPLSKDRITAQEERLNLQTYNAFVDNQQQFKNLAPISPDTRNPYSP